MRTRVLRLKRTKKFLDSLFGHLTVACEGLGMAVPHHLILFSLACLHMPAIAVLRELIRDF